MDPIDRPFRILALDLDGTLLDPGSALRPAVVEAVREAIEAGLTVVPCTGRRFRTALPFLGALGIRGQAVVQNGVLTKDIESGRTLRHRYLERELFESALSVMRSVSPPLVYVDHHEEGFDLFVEHEGEGHPYQAEYVEDQRSTIRSLDRLEELPSDAIVMLSCMAHSEALLALRPRLEDALGGSIRTNFLTNTVYRGHILEAVSAGSGKWQALEAIARDLGVGPEGIAAIGDDENDAEMLANAGLGIAMANAAPGAKASADVVTESNDDDGAAIAIRSLLEGRWP